VFVARSREFGRPLVATFARGRFVVEPIVVDG